MCHSLYVKANGELPCWDDVGEELVLRTLDANRLQEGTERSVFYSPELQHIRQSFLAGKDPHPEFCSRCAVRGHGGGHIGLRLGTMELLHLEASYLCHLSCPQCIPAALRHELKAPPYHLSPAMLEGLLRQLRSEGVRHIKVVHFEGRGDPLMNPWMDQLMALTKSAYPDAYTMATTHGSYPYKPWVVESGLDMLRVSIDGAFDKSYEKYRVGGSLATALKFLRDVRDHKRRLGKDLRVQWKYILFEWNDSDDEITRAADLADELDAGLRFCLTHSPGRSQRFTTEATLRSKLSSLAPNAAIETTFQLKEPVTKYDSVDAVVSEEVTTFLKRALDAIRRRNTQPAFVLLTKALEHDPGFKCPAEITDCEGLIRASASFILTNARFPGTLFGLTAITHELGDHSRSKQLFCRYLLLAAKEDLRKRNYAGAIRRIGRWLRVTIAIRTRLRLVLTGSYLRNRGFAGLNNSRR